MCWMSHPNPRTLPSWALLKTSPNRWGSVQPRRSIILWQIVLSFRQNWWRGWVHLKVDFNIFPTSTYGPRATSKWRFMPISIWWFLHVRTRGPNLLPLDPNWLLSDLPPGLNLLLTLSHLAGSSPMLLNVNKPSSWFSSIQFWEHYVWTAMIYSHPILRTICTDS